MKLVNLIPLREMDFRNQAAFDSYQKQHTLRPDTKVTIAGKTTTAGQASQSSKPVKGTSVFGGNDTPTSKKSVPTKFAAWFTGTVLNGVKHPTYGKNQLTPDQLEKAPAEYKNKLFKAIEKAMKNGDITPDIIKKNS